MNTKKPAEIDSYLNKVIERLKAADPYKIVLFGSYAKGTAKPDSDIDLMVILDSEYFSKNSREKLSQTRKIIDLIDDIHYRYGLDFKVYSRAEFKYLKDRGNFFLDAIESTGETIYEKRN